jgi:hypothetical protein
MTCFNILLLSGQKGKDWKPIGNSSIASEFSTAWDEIVMGSPDFLSFLRTYGLVLDECRCIYPKKRPVHKNIFENCCACAFDLDGLYDNAFLMPELKLIPKDMLTCFVSQQHRICNKRPNYFVETINPDNIEYAIPQFLGMILFSIADNFSLGVFGKTVKNKYGGTI